MFHRKLKPHGARCRKVFSGGVLDLRRGKSLFCPVPLLKGRSRWQRWLVVVGATASPQHSHLSTELSSKGN